MKYKILMLPSWYPTKEDPVAGSFFKEQAQALAQYFDFFVALVTFPSFSFRSFLRQSLRRARISIDASTRLVPEIHCVAYSHMPERILRFFIRRDCFKGTVLKKAERLIEDHYDDRRCRTYLKVYRLLERDYGFKPDLIYAMTAQTNGVEAYSLAKAIGTPVILAEHVPFPFPGSMVTAKVRMAIERCASILSVSNHLSRLILMQRIDCNPIVVGNMIDENRFPLKQTKKAGKSSMNVLFVGAYSFFKDYDTFFKAMAHLRTISGSSFSITIVGYDVSKGYSMGEQKFMDHLNRYNLADICELVSKVSRNDMARYYQKSDLLVSTSIQETFGVACIEAMASGLPVFATKSGGVEDFIDDSCGRLFDLKDYRSLAESINDFFEKRTVFDSMDIRNKIVGRYGINAFTDRISKIFTEAIAAKNIE